MCDEWVQTSPGLRIGIVAFQAVEHHCAFERSPVAEVNILVLRGEFQQSLTHEPQLSFA